MSTLTLRPNGAGSLTQIPNLVGAATSWQAESDASDSTYVWGQVSWDGGDVYVEYSDNYTLADHTTESGTISGVDVYIRGKDETYNGIFSAGLNGTLIVSGNESTITTHHETLPINPLTGVAWTWSDIDSCVFNVDIYYYDGGDSGSANVYVYDVWAVVNYILPPPTLIANLGIVTVSSRIISTKRINSIKNGIKTIISRIIFSKKGIISKLGIKTTISRMVATKRILSAKTGIKVSLVKLLKIYRSCAAKIGEKVSTIRNIVIKRSNTINLGLKGLRNQLISRSFSFSAKLGEKANSNRNFISYRVLSAKDGIKSSIAKVYKSYRVSVAKFGIKTSIARSVLSKRAYSSLLGLKTSVAKRILLSRANIVKLGEKTSFTRAIGIKRTHNVLVGLKTIIFKGISKVSFKVKIGSVAIIVRGGRNYIAVFGATIVYFYF